MSPFISIIIPTYNGAKTIGTCLSAACAAQDAGCEVVVVDDGSNDGSPGMIRNFPCRLIALEKHAGAAAARNAGATAARGDVLFFIDADCVLTKDTLPILRKSLAGLQRGVIMGGTYEPSPYDPGFFNHFQSAFINYSETRNSASPDYIATHALVMYAETFREVGGFREEFLPILEDVEFSHRLRSAGRSLVMNPELRVRHIFNFTLGKSLRNAVKKTRYWIEYSLINKDILADSGTASREMKINGILWLAAVVFAALAIVSGQALSFIALCLLWGSAAVVSRRLLGAFYRSGGGWFALGAGFYYIVIYPAAIWTGVVRGMTRFILRKGRVDKPEKLYATESTGGNKNKSREM